MPSVKNKQSSSCVEFRFTHENMEQATAIIKKYPEANKRSAIMPLLYLAQQQNNNWIPLSAMDYIAELLGVAHMHVYEVAHFYTMYNKKPVGKHLVQICRTTPCWLRGSDGITAACKQKLGIEIGDTTDDGQFTLIEVECLGACVNAPVVQINDDYYEDLTPESITKILTAIGAGKKALCGPQINRINSAPISATQKVQKDSSTGMKAARVKQTNIEEVTLRKRPSERKNTK